MAALGMLGVVFSIRGAVGRPVDGRKVWFLLRAGDAVSIMEGRMLAADGDCLRCDRVIDAW
jgi:hypothetical protein